MLERVARCGYFANQPMGALQQQAMEFAFAGTSQTIRSIRTPGSWWCMLAHVRHSNKPGQQQLAMPGRLVLDPEQRRVVPDTGDPGPAPSGARGIAVVFFGNPTLEQRLSNLREQLWTAATNGQLRTRQAELCRQVTALTADPESLRRQVEEYQKRYLETGALDPLPKPSSIEGDVEQIRARCQPSASRP